MQHMESEGEWGVLQGEYDKQEEDERWERGGCTDVSQKQIQEMHMLASNSHTQTFRIWNGHFHRQRRQQTKKIWSVQSWLFCLWFFSLLCMSHLPPSVPFLSLWCCTHCMSPTKPTLRFSQTDTWAAPHTFISSEVSLSTPVCVHTVRVRWASSWSCRYDVQT